MLSPINARKLVPTQGTYARYLQPRRNRPPRDLSKRNRNRLVESQNPQAENYAVLSRGSEADLRYSQPALE